MESNKRTQFAAYVKTGHKFNFMY